MGSAASTTALRKWMEERFSLLTEELEAFCASEIAARAAAESVSVRRQFADTLNQAVRRLRQSEDLEQISTTLADAATGFCSVAAVFSISQNEVRGVRVRGLAGKTAGEGIASLIFPISEAPAFAGVLETRDAVATLATAAQLSGRVVELLPQPEGECVYLFPLSAYEKPEAVLYAAGAVQVAPLELLAQAASFALEARTRRSPVSKTTTENLVNIQPAAAPARPAWETLTPEEQQRHIRAQRLARVQVAEIRLNHASAVKSGRLRGDLYAELREPIEAARAAYRKAFPPGGSNMVDYLHLELLRTLAHENDALLGKDYPGPLV